MGKLLRAIKPDAQGFDEIRIVTIPRWKESELSGDEWRISASVEFWRKGMLVHSVGYGRNIEKAAMVLGYLFNSALDDGHGYFAGETDFCDQEGCSKRAVVTFRKLFDYENNSGTKIGPSEGYRKFCDKHKTRGNCGIDDADTNYKDVTGSVF